MLQGQAQVIILRATVDVRCFQSVARFHVLQHELEGALAKLKKTFDPSARVDLLRNLRLLLAEADRLIMGVKQQPLSSPSAERVGRVTHKNTEFPVERRRPVCVILAVGSPSATNCERRRKRPL